MPEEVSYSREIEREGKLPLSTKIYQGIGALPDAFKNFAFNTFLLFFYNQVLGLQASLASLAIMIALIIDAVSDPLVGSISDNWKSRLGRRHPFMYASAIPMGLFLYLVFAPPSGLEGWGLFAWMTVFTVATRLAQTFFLVPWSALFAEFSDDYEERSSIVTFRYLCGWIGAIVFTVSTWRFIFPASEAFPQGQLDPSRYDVFAPVLGTAVFLAIFATTQLTRREIPYLLQPDRATPKFSLLRVWDEVKAALGNRDFLFLVLAVLVSFAVNGIGQAFELYMNTYFWGLSGEDLSWFTLSIVGSIIGFGLVVPLQRRFDKKQILIGGIVIYVIDKVVFVSLRIFLDVLPDNGDPLLLVILVFDFSVRVLVVTVIAIMFVSMVADTLDAQELRTGRRQEGVFSAANSFAIKATSGLGVFLAGLILDYVLSFPRGVSVEAMDKDLVNRLAIMDSIMIPLFNLLPCFLLARYRITRETHHEIQTALAERRQAAKLARGALNLRDGTGGA